MTSHGRASLLTVFVVTTLLCASARASESEEVPHLRPLDRGLKEVVAMGIRESASFRALVQRLDDSDVVVYIRCGSRLRSGLSGQLTFLGASGGLRYVVVSIEPGALPERKVAILGHELRHAVEIADTASIVDLPSLGVAYTRIGRAGRAPLGLVFDTTAAIETGAQVWRELMGRDSARSE